MKNYTKGTWTLNMQDGSIHAGKQLVAQVYGATEHNHEANAAECLANAKLILNSPTMLKLLEEFAGCQAHSTSYMKLKVKEFLANLTEADDD